MSYRHSCIVAVVLGLTLAAPPSISAQRQPAARAASTDPRLGRLEAELKRLAAIAGGKVGVAAVHLETGREVMQQYGAEPQIVLGAMLSGQFP